MTSDETAPASSAPPAVGSDSASTPGLPPMVRPAEGAAGDLPIHSGARRVLGIRAGRGAGFYFLAGSGMWSRRYARRFALDQAGWAAAWQAFASEDAEGARQYLAKRAGRVARQADPAATFGSEPAVSAGARRPRRSSASSRPAAGCG